MLGRLNHVALAVPDLAAATAAYRDTLGARLSAPQALPEELVAEGRTIPVARVQAMHEGKRRKRAAEKDLDG